MEEQIIHGRRLDAAIHKHSKRDLSVGNIPSLFQPFFILPSFNFPCQNNKTHLDDLVFYSVLVVNAASYGDWIATLACYVAVLMVIFAFKL